MRAALWNEVKDRLSTSAIGLSGGQQQRLCIARALATEPTVLLLDEPTASLDPISTQAVEELVYELRSDMTIVIVTHNMQQAARVSDSTAFLLDGELVEMAATSDDLHRRHGTSARKPTSPAVRMSDANAMLERPPATPGCGQHASRYDRRARLLLLVRREAGAVRREPDHSRAHGHRVHRAVRDAASRRSCARSTG